MNTTALAITGLTLLASGITDKCTHEAFNILLSSFSPSTIHLSKGATNGNAFGATEKICTISVFKPGPLQSKKRRKTADTFDSYKANSIQMQEQTPNNKERVSKSAARINPYDRTR